MSKIDGLIKKLCPNGVTYKKLGEVCKIEKGKQLNKEQLSDDGSYLVMNGGIAPSGYWNDYNFDEDKITISQGGASAGYINYLTSKFWAGAHCYVVNETNDEVEYKYVYHFLKEKQKYLLSSQVGAGIPSISLKEINGLNIPLPPIQVQKEIALILDKFSELEAELEAELEVRKNQYEFWRAKLFTSDNLKQIEDICINISSGGTPKTSHSEYYGGSIPWLRTQEVNWNIIKDTEIKITDEAIKHSSAKIIPTNCVIVAMYGATAGRVAINSIPLSTNQACCNLEINPQLADYKYVFYWLSNQYKYIKSLGQGSQTNINVQTVRKIKIPLPSIEEQKRIVGILDKFDKLVNDITVGIPAEIELRRQQYEFYRNKLLSFEELSVGE